MSKTTTATGYIAHDGNLIFGYGATIGEAMRMVESWVEPDDDADDLEVDSASASLITRVQANGGNIAWTIEDGVAVTYDELDA